MKIPVGSKNQSISEYSTVLVGKAEQKMVLYSRIPGAIEQILLIQYGTPEYILYKDYTQLHYRSTNFRKSILLEK
jgi:hypothetical protein